MSFGIVEAGPAYAAVIAALHNRVMEEGWGADSVARLLALPGAFALLAGQGETNAEGPAGMILCVPGAAGLEIASLVVAAGHRRAGLGSALLDGASARAASAGTPALDLEVRADNIPALALYRGKGFREVGRRRRYYPARGGRPATDALLLRLDLGAAAS